MLVPRSTLDVVWKHLVPSLQTRGRVLHFMVSGDVDAISALIIMQDLLYNEQCMYDVHPVFDYDHLLTTCRSVIESTRVTSQPAAIMLINCGGIVDLEKILNLEEPENSHCMIYVLDSHRPYNLNNVNETNERVVLLSDGNERFPDLAQFESYSDDEDDDNDPLTRTTAQIERRARAARRKADRKDAIRTYYQETYYGMPAAVLAYELCQMAGKDKNGRSLWSACVGLTDHLIHERLDYRDYDLLVNELNTAVSTMLTDETAIPIDNPVIQRSSNDTSTLTRAVSTIKTGAITFLTQEPRLIHLRHAPLLDCFSWSPFISSRLRRYTPDGNKHIATVLLEMSISMSAAKSQFMSTDTTNKLEIHMDSVIAMHPRLREMRWPTFQRQQSQLLKLSAVDLVYLGSALLEQPVMHQSTEDPHVSGAGPNKRVKTDGSMMQTVMSTTELQQHQLTCWWQAFCLLDRGETNLTNQAFDLSKHSLIVQNRLALSLVAKKGAITKTGPFRYVVLDQPELHATLHWHALMRLGFLILDCLIEQSEKAANTGDDRVASEQYIRRPLVIASFVPALDRYQVIGIAGTMRMTEPRAQNRFGFAFRRAADAVQAKQWIHQHFETAVAEIGKDSIKHFIEYMHHELIAI